MKFWLSLMTVAEHDQLPDIARYAEELGFHGATVPLTQQAFLGFTAPGLDEIGNTGRNSTFGPNFFNTDMAVQKNFPIHESLFAQFRMDAYNAFNHTEWGSFNTAITFNSAGQIINLPTQLGGTGGRLGFGALNSVRANSQRILQIGVKFNF